MRGSRKLAAVVATAGLVLGGGVWAGASADAAKAPVTLKFTTHSLVDHRVGKVYFAGTEVVKKHGKVIGYDTLSGKFNPSTNAVTIQVAVALKGGILLVALDPTKTTTYVGTVVGGAGKFAGATGTINAHSPSENSDITHVTIHYSLP
jgi:hypothetical protein